MFISKQQEILAIHCGQGLATVEMFGKLPRSPSLPAPVLMYVLSFDLFGMKRSCFSSVITHQEAKRFSLIKNVCFFFRQIVFEGVVGKSFQGDIAIDDLKLIRSPCPYPGDYIFFCFKLNESVYHFPSDVVSEQFHSTILEKKRPYLKVP